MKLRTLFLTALVALGSLAPVTNAKADHCERTRVTYDSCGRAIYWAYRVVGYDCHGCPIYSWVRTGCSAPREERHEESRGGYGGDYRGRSDYGRGYEGVGYGGPRCGTGHSGGRYGR